MFTLIQRLLHYLWASLQSYTNTYLNMQIFLVDQGPPRPLLWLYFGFTSDLRANLTGEKFSPSEITNFTATVLKLYY